MEDNGGFLRRLGKLDPKDETENNFSVLRPFGVWAVISPFNFPMALSGAPQFPPLGFDQADPAPLRYGAGFRRGKRR